MEFEVFDWGLVEYSRALSLQKEAYFKVKEGNPESALIICSHYPVITIGRLGERKNLLVSEEELLLRAVSLFWVERGGDITYHGPGQLTAYPIFNLACLKKDIHFFLRNLEEVALCFLMGLGIKGQRLPGLTGVWLGDKKIASVGIAVKNWITYHGLTINIKSNDLENFRLIRPCGMDVEMTCAEEALGRELEMCVLKKRLIEKFQEVFCPAEAILWQR